MNTERDNEADEDIGAIYRDGDGLRAPEALNRAVLDEARRAVHAPPTVMPSWLRPLAFAATLALGVGLLFEMQAVTPLQESGSVQSNGMPPDVPAVRARELPATPAPSAAPVMSDEEQTSSSRVLKFRDTGTEPAAIAEQETGGAPLGEVSSGVRLQQAPAADLDAQSLRYTDGNAETMERRESMPERQAGKPLNSQPSEQPDVLHEEASQAAKFEARSALRQSAQLSADRASMLPDAEYCADATDTAEWWQCIVRLRESGEMDAADAELARLLEAHPDFTAPE
jgi:hypothetical protein